MCRSVFFAEFCCHRERKRGDPPELLLCRLFGGIAAVATLLRNDSENGGGECVAPLFC